ncbi:MAG: ATP-dependent zinc metalloprotease FtsH [Planctomycetota bacterium]|jgi:cell division protease FtsH|nr:ATP-dependent zinc metalloprotease FtsH [Planctomycetota bacterium]
MPEQPKPQPPKPRGLLPVVIAFVGLLLFTLWMTRQMRAGTEEWSNFLETLASGEVAEVTLGRSYAIYLQETGGAERKVQVNYPFGRPLSGENDRLYQAAYDAGNEARGDKGKTLVHGVEGDSAWSSILPQLVIFGLVIVALYFFVFRRIGQGGGVLSFGKSRAMLVSKGKTSKSFKDVAGIDEARDEVEELVEFLRQPRKFQKLGGRIPCGVLLVGPPGTGKTLLARAIAGEADVPFYSISGSDFVEMFVGVGASRVRDLFQQAKDNAPCIIFIDEVDAVARRRGSGVSSGGHDEREQTLNAILVEMDGFNSNDKVIVIAATNRVDVLDPALLRPGRFDRHIHVNLPDIAGREQILAVHSKRVKLSDDVDMTTIARGTPGFSGADLENLINEGALNAARHEKDAVHHIDLEYARDRVAFGREKKTGSQHMPQHERKITAYHEAGHTVIQAVMEDCEDLHKVSIIPRGRALGATMMLPKQDRYTHSRRKLYADICQLFGGRIAEDRFCGDITTGASNDIERATSIARGMVYEWGMSDKMGPIKYTDRQDMFGNTDQVVHASAATYRELDEEVRKIIDEQYKRAEKMIDDNAEALTRVAEALLEHETLTAAQVDVLMNGGQIEPRVPTVVIDKSSDDEEAAEVVEKPQPESDDDSVAGLDPKPA